MNKRYDIRKFLNALSLIILGMVFGVIYYGTYKAHSQSYESEKNPPETKIEYVYIESEPEIITETVYVEVEPTFYRSFSESEAYYLKDLGMREIEGGNVNDFLWVFYTAECRKEAFGYETYEEVWRSDAFNASWSRRGIEPNENCEIAFAIFEEGWIPKPLWFRADYYHGFGTPLCQVGSHYFSTK